MDFIESYIENEQKKVAFLLNHDKELLDIMYKTKNVTILEFFSELRETSEVLEKYFESPNKIENILSEASEEDLDKIFYSSLSLFNKADKVWDIFMNAAKNIKGE